MKSFYFIALLVGSVLSYELEMSEDETDEMLGDGSGTPFTTMTPFKSQCERKYKMCMAKWWCIWCDCKKDRRICCEEDFHQCLGSLLNDPSVYQKCLLFYKSCKHF